MYNIIDGTMVFVTTEGQRPFWVIEFQPNNGSNGSYWLTDAEGNQIVCTRDEFNLQPMIAV